jgi:uncharacterized protein
MANIDTHYEAERFHRYFFSDSEIHGLFDDQFHRDVIASPAFTRLKSVHFLGAIDYLQPKPNQKTEERHSRYNHSLAVASLAKQYCEEKMIVGEDRRYCVAAALLHDIGHAPLSHSLEPVFKSKYEIDHHVSGDSILRGEVEIGRKLARTLAQAKINNFRVMSIIAGRDKSQFNELFSRSVNVDTAEAILRCNLYMVTCDMQITAPRVIEAMVRMDRWAEEVLDEFWRLKQLVYSKLIQSEVGILADYICKRYMEINLDTFAKDYYFATERALKARHGKLFAMLKQLGKTNSVDPSLLSNGLLIPCTVRSFYIDQSIKLTDSNSIDARYRQSKRRIELAIRPTRRANARNTEEHQRSFSFLKRDD